MSYFEPELLTRVRHVSVKSLNGPCGEIVFFISQIILCPHTLSSLMNPRDPVDALWNLGINHK